MTIRFVKYGSVPGSTSKLKYIDPNEEWVVTEKVHGANFSFHVDQQGFVRPGKRRGFVDANENFFDYQEVVCELMEPIQKAAKRVMSEEEQDVQQVIFYGELFGGHYPSDDQDEEKKAPANAEGSKDKPNKPVQKGIWYSPDKHFILFDIAIIRQNEPEVHVFLPYKRTVEIATEEKLFYAEPLWKGPYHKAVNHNPKFITTIPKRLGLEDLKDNLAEGIVIKKWDSFDTMNTKRPILKIKIAEFKEGGAAPKQHKRGDEAFRGWIRSLINPNRLAAAISKVGDPLVVENQSEIIDLVLEDIREETGGDKCVDEMLAQLRCLAYDTLRDHVSD